MIHRANVRSRVYVPNIQTKDPRNKKFSPRNFRLYTRRCNWCKRPNYWSAWNWMGLCIDCGKYLNLMHGHEVWVNDCLENDVLISDMIDQ